MNSRPDERTDQLASPHTADCAFVLENIEGFVLDALDRFERGVVEHHLRWCLPCQALASSYERVVERLAFAVPLDAPPAPEIKSQLFARIAASDQEASGMQIRHAESRPPPQPDRRPAANNWRHNLAAALIAPLALSLLVMGVWANSMRTDLDEQSVDRPSQAQLNEALANGGQVALYSVEKESSCPGCHGSGQLGMSETNDMGMVLGWNFDPDQRHDVWGVSDDGARTKMCELQVDQAGAVMQMFSFPDPPSAFTQVYITDENGSMTYISHLTQGDETPAADVESGSPIS